MSHAHALLVLLASLGSAPRGEVLEFSATWCAPCQQMSPLVSRLEREGLPIRKVDVDQERPLTESYHVTNIPCFILVVDGEEVTRLVGWTSEAELRRMIARIPVAPPVREAPAPFVAETGAPRSVPLDNGQAQRSRDSVASAVETQPVAPPQPPKRNFYNMLAGGNRGAAEQIARGNNEDARQMPAATSNDPMSASIRIRVTINDQIHLGSGTVVDSRPGRTLIVTCGHIFRDRNDPSKVFSKVDVDLFEAGQPRTYVGSVVGYDLDADVGLIAVPTEVAVPHVQVAPAQLALASGDAVACIGCSGGSDPTREQLYVTAVNKYTGPDNIECSGVPVQGRSGGGLFNASNQLIGVCIAADENAGHGLYAHAFAVHTILDKHKLSHLYRPRSESQPPPFVAEAAPPELLADESFVSIEQPSATRAAIAAEASAGDMALANAMSEVPAGDAEVVIIIRPRNQPDAPSRVVIINQASSKFFAYLNGEMHQQPQAIANSGLRPTTQTIGAGESPLPPRSSEARRMPSEFDAAATTARQTRTQPPRR